ncbi:MAG: KTSC domain-containing protein [Chryseobacterium sp.]|nr:MAG: KTSC domain-containing protein [Chryseobacterium sp.]
MPSSVIRRYHYNPDTETLRIEFVSGAVYDYLCVPRAVYEDFQKWTSRGSFLSRFIKGRYRYMKIRDAED